MILELLEIIFYWKILQFHIDHEGFYLFQLCQFKYFSYFWSPS